MKKILGILGTITIAGGGMTGIIGNAPTQAKNEIKYLQTNNLENLNRVKRGNENVLRIKAKSLGHDWLYAKISHETWKTISFKHNILNNQEFKNWLYIRLLAKLIW